MGLVYHKLLSYITNSVQEVIQITYRTAILLDSIKLLLPLTEAEYVGFEVERNRFFRSQSPHIPTTKNEDMLTLLGTAEKQVGTMVLSKGRS